MKTIHDSIMYDQSVISGQGWYTIRVSDQWSVTIFVLLPFWAFTTFLTLVNFWGLWIT